MRLRALPRCLLPSPQGSFDPPRVKSSGWGGEGTLKFGAGLVVSSVSAKPGWLPSRGGLGVKVALIRDAMASFRCCRRLSALRSKCRAVSSSGCPWWFWKRGGDVGPPRPAPTGLTHSMSWLWGRALGASPIEAECAPRCGAGASPRRAGTPGQGRAPPSAELARHGPAASGRVRPLQPRCASIRHKVCQASRALG